MIPEGARSLITLHLNNARQTESDSYAEEALATVTGMLGYALAVNHITASEYSNELVMVQLVRAQRKNKANAARP